MEALSPLEELLRSVLTFVSGLAGVGFTIAFVIYGFKLAGSASNPAARANSVTGLWWTVMGAIVSFGAFFIVRLLEDIARDLS
jgi:TRAP-type C4-dicarboxylate transport system permease small subunit